VKKSHPPVERFEETPDDLVGEVLTALPRVQNLLSVAGDVLEAGISVASIDLNEPKEKTRHKMCILAHKAHQVVKLLESAYSDLDRASTISFRLKKNREIDMAEMGDD